MQGRHVFKLIVSIMMNKIKNYLQVLIIVPSVFPRLCQKCQSGISSQSTHPDLIRERGKGIMYF